MPNGKLREICFANSEKHPDYKKQMWEIFFLHLLSYNLIFIVQSVERTVETSAPQETAHIIFIHIHHTNIIVMVLIILIIAAAVTVAHARHPAQINNACIF